MYKRQLYCCNIKPAILITFSVSYLFDTSFFKSPRITHPTTEPTARDSRYNSGWPTVKNTKIPPCGAINVQLNAMDNAPATAFMYVDLEKNIFQIVCSCLLRSYPVNLEISNKVG